MGLWPEQVGFQRFQYPDIHNQSGVCNRSMHRGAIRIQGCLGGNGVCAERVSAALHLLSSLFERFTRRPLLRPYSG